jgi:thioredoxin-related protein
LKKIVYFLIISIALFANDTSVDDDKIKLKHEVSITNPKQEKINLIFVTQSGCGACKQIKEYIKENEVKNILKKDFNLYEVDINFKEELPFEWMKPVATPTLYFLGKKDDEIIEHITKKFSKKEFIQKLKEAVIMRDMD